MAGYTSEPGAELRRPSITPDLGSDVRTWKLGLDTKSDTAVSEDAPQWFRGNDVRVLANMRPAFDPNAMTGKRWDRSDTAMSTDVPDYMTGKYTAFWKTPDYPHAKFVSEQHTPRARVQNATTAYMIEERGPAGPGGRAETVYAAAREAAFAQDDHMHPQQRELLARQLDHVKALAKSGRVALDAGAVGARPISAPARPRPARQTSSTATRMSGSGGTSHKQAPSAQPNARPPAASAASSRPASAPPWAHRTGTTPVGSPTASPPPSVAEAGPALRARARSAVMDLIAEEPSRFEPARHDRPFRTQLELLEMRSAGTARSAERTGTGSSGGGTQHNSHRARPPRPATAGARMRGATAFAERSPRAELQAQLADDRALVQSLRHRSSARTRDPITRAVVMWDPVLHGVQGLHPTSQSQRLSKFSILLSTEASSTRSARAGTSPSVGATPSGSLAGSSIVARR